MGSPALTAQPFLAFPLDVGPDRSLVTTGGDEHLRDLILQVLLTQPGERLNLPEFGCGIAQLLFAGPNDVLRATAQFVITQSLERWLGDRLSVESVDVSSPGEVEGTLTIQITYLARATQQPGQVSVLL